MSKISGVSILGANVTSEETGGRLECFAAPVGLEEVTLTTDEVYANCPITGQPDFYSLKVRYQTRSKCVESKSFKLYIHTLKDTGIFGEALACKIAKDVYEATDAWSVTAELIQKPRGGISITSLAEFPALSNING